MGKYFEKYCYPGESEKEGIGKITKKVNRCGEGK